MPWIDHQLTMELATLWLMAITRIKNFFYLFLLGSLMSVKNNSLALTLHQLFGTFIRRFLVKLAKALQLINMVKMVAMDRHKRIAFCLLIYHGRLANLLNLSD